MTTKQRAYLKSLAMTMDPVIKIGKNCVTPEVTAAVSEALEARELIKLSVLQNCVDDPKEMADYILNNLHGMTFPGWEPERMEKLDELFAAYKPVTKEVL